MRNSPPQNLFEAVLAPMLDLLSLARTAAEARLDLARHEAGLRVKALFLAAGLGLAALILLGLALHLMVQTLLIGLVVAGLTLFQAHLATLALALVGIALLLLWASAAIGRAFRPLLRPANPPSAATGPAPISTPVSTSADAAEANASAVDLSVRIVKTHPASDQIDRSDDAPPASR